VSSERQLEIFKQFVANCSVGSTKVFVMRGAMKTAEIDFGISQMDQVLTFIADGGLEEPRFINEKPWENNPEPAVKIMVCAWSFFSGTKFGYLAFFHQPKTGKWNIKSFKLNREPDPRNLAFKGLQELLNKGSSHE